MLQSEPDNFHSKSYYKVQSTYLPVDKKVLERLVHTQYHFKHSQNLATHKERVLHYLACYNEFKFYFYYIYEFVYLTLILQACSINLLAFSSALYLFGSWTLKNFRAPSKSACRRSSFEVCKIITKNLHYIFSLHSGQIHWKSCLFSWMHFYS